MESFFEAQQPSKTRGSRFWSSEGELRPAYLRCFASASTLLVMKQRFDRAERAVGGWGGFILAVGLICPGCAIQLGEETPGGSEATKGVSTSSARPNANGAGASTSDSSETTATNSQGSAPEVENSIKDRLARDTRFAQLYSALAFAELLDELDRAGSWTLFAPSNAAFEELSEKAKLELAADKQAMRELLLNHMLPERRSHERLLSASSFASRAGYPLVSGVSPQGDAVLRSAGTGTVGRRDLLTGNGVIHEVDGLLFPPKRNLWELVGDNDEFSEFKRLAEAAKLGSQLASAKKLTVFIPSNQAVNDFAQRIGSSAFDALLLDASKLKDVLDRHMHADYRSLDDIGLQEDLPSLVAGAPLRFRVDSAPFSPRTVNGRKVSAAEVKVAKNGLIFMVEGTLHDGP